MDIGFDLGNALVQSLQTPSDMQILTAMSIVVHHYVLLFLFAIDYTWGIARTTSECLEETCGVAFACAANLVTHKMTTYPSPFGLCPLLNTGLLSCP